MGSSLKDKLATTTTPTGGTSIVAYLNSPTMMKQISRAASNGLSADRLMRLALTQLRTNKKMQECTKQSIVSCLMTSAQLGLEPGPLGLCYYIPYENRRLGTVECQFQLGYQGILALARRSGEILNIDAHVVYENDEFSYSYGLNPTLVHVPAATDRGQPVFFYAVANYKNGGFNFNVMSVADVEKIRERSKAQGGPWTTDYEAMCLKTVIKSLRKFLPLTTEAATALATEDRDDIDISDALVDLDTGEIIEGTAEEVKE